MSGPEQSIADLFGCPVSAGQSAPDAAALAQLDPRERSVVGKAVEKRRAEFAGGRLAARAALAGLGITNQPILRDPSGAPRWPRGIVGSITHTDGFCGAVVAREGDAAGLGLDAEPDEPLERGLGDIICTPRERTALRPLRPEEVGRHLRCVFCAKEAFYKAQYPLTSRFLEFTDVEVRWSEVEPCRPLPGRAAFTVDALRHRDVSRVARRGTGVVLREHGYVLASFTIPP